MNLVIGWITFEVVRRSQQGVDISRRSEIIEGPEGGRVMERLRGRGHVFPGPGLRLEAVAGVQLSARPGARGCHGEGGVGGASSAGGGGGVEGGAGGRQPQRPLCRDVP